MAKKNDILFENDRGFLRKTSSPNIFLATVTFPNESPLTQKFYRHVDPYPESDDELRARWETWQTESLKVTTTRKEAKKVASSKKHCPFSDSACTNLCPLNTATSCIFFEINSNLKGIKANLERVANTQYDSLPMIKLALETLAPMNSETQKIGKTEFMKPQADWRNFFEGAEPYEYINKTSHDLYKDLSNWASNKNCKLPPQSTVTEFVKTLWADSLTFDTKKSGTTFGYKAPEAGK